MHRRATTAERRQTGSVVITKVGMREELASHHRHRAQRINLLPLNELERLLGIPLVHQHQLATTQGRAVHHAIIGRNVK